MRVIPVLVNGAQPLQASELPPEIAGLARLSALEISDSRYEDDTRRLLDRIHPLVAGKPGPEVASGIAADDESAARMKQARMTRLLIEAKRIAESIPSRSEQAVSLAKIAALLMHTDPMRAARIISDAESIALSNRESRIRGEQKLRKSLLYLDGNYLGLSPDVLALLDFTPVSAIAMSIAVADPDRAERIARSIPRKVPGRTLAGNLRSETVADIAKVIAATDPDRANRMARSLNVEQANQVLIEIARAVAAADPARAERITWSVFGVHRNGALAEIAAAVAAADKDRAERIAHCIEGDPEKSALTLARIAATVAATHPDRATWLLDDAERIARSIADDPRRTAFMLANLAVMVTAADPERTAALLTAAELSARSIAGEEKDRTLAGIAAVVAAVDPDRADRVAQSIGSGEEKERALVRIAEVVAAADPDRAERLARSITSAEEKVRALLAIAEADHFSRAR